MSKTEKFLIHNIKAKNKGPVLGIVVGAHGDEAINVRILNLLKKFKIIKGEILLIVANLKAIKVNKRFIEADLNRVFPGNKRGNYEEVLAYKLTPIINQCDYLIDFHAFEKKSPPFVVLPIKTELTISLALCSEMEHIVYMPGQGKSLVEQAKTGIGVELGTMKDSKNIERGLSVCRKVMAELGMLTDDSVDKKNISRKFYLSNKKLSRPKGFKKSQLMKNFHLIKKGQAIGTAGARIIKAKEDFYPILLDSPSLGKNYLCRIGKLIKETNN